MKESHHRNWTLSVQWKASAWGFIGNLLLHAGTIRFPFLPLNFRPIFVSMGYPFVGNKLKIVSNEGFANTSSPEKGIYKFKKTGQENETNARERRSSSVNGWWMDGWLRISVWIDSKASSHYFFNPMAIIRFIPSPHLSTSPVHNRDLCASSHSGSHQVRAHVALRDSTLYQLKGTELENIIHYYYYYYPHHHR